MSTGISDDLFLELHKRHQARMHSLDVVAVLLNTLKRLMLSRECYRNAFNELEELYDLQARIWTEIKDEYYGNKL